MVTRSFLRHTLPLIATSPLAGQNAATYTSSSAQAHNPSPQARNATVTVFPHCRDAACRVSTAGSATGTTGPSATSTCAHSVSKRPSASSRKRPLLLLVKRLASVMCIARLCALMPRRSTPRSCDVSSTTRLNSSRLSCCAAVRGLCT